MFFVYIGESRSRVGIYHVQFGQFGKSDFCIFHVLGPLAQNPHGQHPLISPFSISARHSDSFGCKDVSSSTIIPYTTDLWNKQLTFWCSAAEAICPVRPYSDESDTLHGRFQSPF